MFGQFISVCMEPQVRDVRERLVCNWRRRYNGRRHAVLRTPDPQSTGRIPDLQVRHIDEVLGLQRLYPT